MTSPPPAPFGVGSRGALACLAAAALALPIESEAQWAPDGNPVVRGSGLQSSRGLVSDGAGGAIVMWADSEGRADGFRVQRITSLGHGADGWPATGRLVTSADSAAARPNIVGDGQGGCLLAWMAPLTDTTGSVKVMRVTADGIRVGGPVTYDAGGATWIPILAGDDAGATFVGWAHHSAGVTGLRLLRLDPAGGPAPGWPAAGAVLGGSRREYLANVIADGAGGAYLLTYSFAGDRVNLFLHHGDSSGVAPGWPDTGIVVRRDAGQTSFYSMIPSGDGVIVTWWDYSNGQGDIFAQRYAGSGTVGAGWPPGGLVVCGHPAYQANPIAVPDGAGGAVILWLDFRGPSGESDLYAKRVSASGQAAPGWPADGAPVCTAPGHQFQPALARDGMGGYFAAWEDRRRPDTDLLAQRLLGDGSVAPGWAVDGTPLCDLRGDQVEPHIAADGQGNALIAWTDGREGDPAGSDYDVYATRVSVAGAVGTPPIAAPVVLLPPWPNPASEGVTFTVDLRVAARASAEVLDASGRAFRTIVSGELLPAGRTVLSWDGRDAEGGQARQGIYFIRVRAAGFETSRRLVVAR